MLKIPLLLMLLLTGSLPATFHREPQLDALKKEVIKDILSATVNETNVREYAKNLRADGSWADIDYTDKTRGGWLVADHLGRLQAMAIMHARENGSLYDDPVLRSKILSALDFWIKNDFICPNWWYPEIGVPKILGPTMLLMQKYLSPAQIEGGVKILNRAKIGMTGQNKVWLSGNVIYRSLITNELSQVQAAVNAIQNEITMSEGEGVQADNSFHQHGPQQQFGNYGLSFAMDMLKWGRIFQPTDFQFSANKISILRNYLLEGMKWVIWKDKMDISACGRQLFPGAQISKAKYMSDVYEHMEDVDPFQGAAYRKALQPFDGDIHFWRSDMTVHRRKNFYSSVKMSSTRVAGAESCNEENLGGYHLGDGATYFYQSNEEYTDIFPFWDWKKIPGTTTFHDEAPLPILSCDGYRLATDFVGGVSNGINGIAAMAYTRDSLRANKSWFFFEDATVCLGEGISSDLNKPVFTTVNQSFLKTNVQIKSGEKVSRPTMGAASFANTSWIIQDSWGYYFPGRKNIALSNKMQEGDWHKVLKRMPSKTMQAPIFTLWLDHGRAPKQASYAYIVLADAKPSSIESRGRDISILANNDSLQAAGSAQKKLAGIVFLKPATLKSAFTGKISADQPCVLLLTKNSGQWQLSVADPTHKLQKITITIEGRFTSDSAAASYSAQSKSTICTIELPSGPGAGKSVFFTLTNSAANQL